MRSMRSKDLPQELRGWVLTRHISGQGYKRILLHILFLRAQWPPSFFNGTSLGKAALCSQGRRARWAQNHCCSPPPNWAIWQRSPVKLNTFGTSPSNVCWSTWFMTLTVFCRRKAALFLSSLVLGSSVSCWIISSAALLNNTYSGNSTNTLCYSPQPWSWPWDCISDWYTHSSMAIGLKVHTNVKLLGCMVKVLNSSLSAPHYYLSNSRIYEHGLL